MQQKQSYDHFRWIIGQAAGLSSPSLLEAFANEGDRLVDLRYGDQKSNERLLAELEAPDSTRLYLWVDSSDCFARYGDHLVPQACLIFGSTSLEEENRDFFEEISGKGDKFGFEVNSGEQARLASEYGARFLIISGNEAYGSVSDKTSLILSQEIVPSTLLPVIVRGDLGPYAAAAVSALGAAGVILDTPLLLAAESPLDAPLRKQIESLSATDSLILGHGQSRRFRMSGQPGLTSWKALQEKERAILADEPDAGRAEQAVASLYWEASQNGFSDTGAEMFPLGQGVPFAATLAKRCGSVLKIIEHYEFVRRESVSAIKEAFPFVEGSPLARSHQTRFPIVQGPMANVTEQGDFAKAISDEGALPFLALNSLAPDKVLEVIKSTKEALGEEPFGVGLAGCKSSPEFEDQVNLILKEKPPYVTVSGGDAGVAKRFEEAGIQTYLHASTPHHARTFLEEGAQRLVFEGHEAGGSIGSLGSALLWEQGVEAILEVCEADQSRTPKGVLFAGGIAHFRSVLMAAIIAEPLVRKGIPVGIQLGTAYLSTEEIVDTKTVQAHYRSKVIAGDQTLSFGHSIDRPTRCIESQFARELLDLERKLEADTSLTLDDRKIRIEEENRAHLGIAAKGIQRNSDGTTGYESVSEDEQLKSGAYHAGQGISQIWQARTIKQLHAFLLENARTLAASLDDYPAWKEGSQGASEAEWDDDDAIAIVGMSCRVPGANDCDTFWENILKGESSIREMKSDYFDSDPYYKNPQHDSLKLSSVLGAFINPINPNPKRYKIPPNVAASIDPIQWLILELVEQALASGKMVAGDLPQEKTTVIIGNSGGGEWPYSYRLLANAPLLCKDLDGCGSFDDLPEEKKEELKKELVKKIRERTPPIEQDSWYVGQLPTIIAGRVANAYNFNGGCSVVDAACASGLSAIDIAMDGLRKGKYGAAVVGAAEMRMDPGTYIGFSALNALSKNGCFPFDQKADGTVIADGAGMVILKTLKDARRDGNTIFSLIRSMGSSTDGQGKGLTAPNYKGQITAMQRAYQSSGINPKSISYIEAHGTGTPLGDESELLSTSTILNEHAAGLKSCLIGSVKAQIGHLRASAGMVGLIKAVLALHHKKLPPNVNCSNPTDVIDWDKSPLYMQDKAKPWIRQGGPLRAGVNAFGFGGVNYHAVLEEAPRRPSGDRVVAAIAEPTPNDDFPAELFIYSAEDRSSLIQSLEEHISTVSGLETGDPFFAYSMECYRKANVDHPVLSIVADSPEGLKRRLNDSIKLLKESSSDDFQVASGIYYSESKDRGKVAFLCPGQGAHFIGMGSELAHFFPQVRPIFDTVEAQFKSMTGESLLGIMWVPDGVPCAKPISIPDPTHVDAAQLARTDRSQPAIVAVSVAIAELLDLAGLRPEMAAGHSLGEYTSCYLAGAINLETLIHLVTRRGGAMSQHKEGRGAMAAISAPIEEIEKTLEQVEGYVIIANRNCPAQSTISGEEEAVKEACALIQKQGYDALLLAITVAFHTKMVAPISDTIFGMRNSVKVGRIKFPIQSNVTGDFYPDDVPFDESFWDLISKHAASPVRFMENLDSLYQGGARTFIELGPGSALTGFTQATLTSEPVTAGSCMLRKGSQVTQFLRMMGLLASKGKKPNLERLFAHRIAAFDTRSGDPVSEVPSQAAPGDKEPTQTDPAGEWLPSLPNVSPEDLEQYLAHRGDYLREMMRHLVDTDYRHFSQQPPPRVTTPGLIAQEGSGEATGANAEESTMVLEVKRIFSEKTGYPVEDLEMELDLEADLGIDSIKQTEILQDIRAFFDLENGFTVARSAVTLSDWVQAVSEEHPGNTPEVPPQDSSPAHPAVQNTILDIFSEKTGYPIADLDLALDLEADLGIDSIKQTEILQKIRESFTFEEEGFTVSRDAVSISDWVERVQSALKIEESSGVEAGEESSRKVDRTPNLPQAKTNARAWVTRLVGAANENVDQIDFAGKNILLLGNKSDGNHAALERELKSRNAEVLCFDDGFTSPLKQLPDFVIDLGRGEGCAQEAWRKPDSWWDAIEELLGVRYTLANALNGHLDEKRVCTLLALTTPGDELATTLQGFYRCFHQEHPGLNLKILEYQKGASREALSEQLIQELNQVSRPVHVVYTEEGRHIEQWVEKKFEHEATPLTSCMKEDAVILSIGGARGVTATLSDALIRELKNPTVIVTGRDAEEDIHSVPPMRSFDELKQEILDSHAKANSSITPVKLEQASWRELFRRERAAKILDYEKKGISVVYKQLDVVDGAAMKGLLQFCESRYGRIDLVIHGAAILIERQLAMTRYEDFLKVVRIRGLGTANLMAGLAELEHKPTVINLGTGGARFGSPGLTAYGSGHQLAACLVEQWGSAFATHAKTLIYGPWLDIGMTRQGNSAERFRNLGADFVTPEKGCAFLINELKSWEYPEIVLRGKPEATFDLKNVVGRQPAMESCEFPFKSEQWAKALGLGRLEIGRMDFPVSEAFTQRFEATLSAREREQLQKFSAVSRRSEFMAGRITAKATWLHYQGDTGNSIAHPDLSIVSERGKAPVLEHGGQSVPGVFLSISHSESTVLAAVCDQRIGIDVQRFSDSISGFVESFTDDGEIEAVRSSYDCGNDPKILTAIWAAKEAIMKACPKPLGASSLRLDKVDWIERQFRMRFGHSDEGHFDAIVELLDGEAVAVARQIVSRGGESDKTTFRDEIVKELGKACVAELGNSPQSDDDDLFFDLGCTSISAAAIIRKLEVRFDVRIPLNLLMSYSTVSELAGLVEEKMEAALPVQENPSESSGEVVLNSAPKPVLFWAQWLGPNFVRQYLPGGQKAHFIKGHWYDDSMDHLTDLKSIVDAYVDEIRGVQPKGPYVMGGYCFGGFLVYEIAKVLQAAGEVVDHIFLLDPFLPYNVIHLEGGYSASESERIDIALKDSYNPENHQKPEINNFYDRVVNHLKFRVRQWKVARQLKKAESGPAPLSEELRGIKVLSLYRDLTVDYQVTPYHGKTTVIANVRRPKEFSELWEIMVPAPNLNFVQTSCRDHTSIAEEPDIQSWVNELAAILGDADE